MYNYLRSHLRNTWVQKLPITSKVYIKIAQRRNRQAGNPIAFGNLSLWVDPMDITIVPGLIASDYETFELDLLTKLAKSHEVFLDVGANIGIHSLTAAKAMGSEGRVVALEPVSDNIALLEKNIAENKASNVDLIPKAAGAKEDKTTIFKQANSIGTHSIAHNEGATESIDVVTIDSLKLKPDLVKIDVEGYEVEALKGARKTMAHTKFLFIEYAPEFLRAAGSSLDDLSNCLNKYFDFFFQLDEKRSRLIPVKLVDIQAVGVTNILACKGKLPKALEAYV